MSITRKGHACSDATRQKMRENLMGNKYGLGHKHTEETKKRMGEVHIGNKNTLGFRHSEESKKKMTGRPRKIKEDPKL